MKKLILVALIMGTLYVFILRAVANFITRDKDDYLKKLQITDAESRASHETQTRLEFLHRQTLDQLISLLCESSTDNESCFNDPDEKEFMKREVVKIEDLLTIGPESNLQGTFFSKPQVKEDRKQMIYDIWYKRVVTDILLYRERQISLLLSPEEQNKMPFSRPAKGRFADYEDITPLLKSFGIGVLLLLAVNVLLPDVDIRSKEKKHIKVN